MASNILAKTYSPSEKPVTLTFTKSRRRRQQVSPKIFFKLLPDCTATRVIRQRHYKVYSSEQLLVSYPKVCRPTLQQDVDHLFPNVLCSNRDYRVFQKFLQGCHSDMLYLHLHFAALKYSKVQNSVRSQIVYCPTNALNYINYRVIKNTLKL